MANQIAGYAKPMKMPVWRGESLIGKTITVVAEQGFGDIIQYARFLPALKVMGAAKVVVLTVPANIPLLGQMECIDQLTNLTEEGPAHECDYWIGSMSLPHFATYAPPYVKTSYPITKEKIVGSEGYFDAIASNIERKIGFNWHASNGPLHYVKSLPLAEFRKMLGDNVYSLHINHSDVFDTLPNDGWQKNFYKTACHMKAMKAVVAPDTATAHLAGSLGVKCFLMLPEDDYVCWRWRHGTWYDSIVPIKKSEWHTLPKLLEAL